MHLWWRGGGGGVRTMNLAMALSRASSCLVGAFSLVNMYSYSVAELYPPDSILGGLAMFNGSSSVVGL